MDECRHANILIINQNTDRVRCRHCHLTIKAEDLDDGYCPECFSERGIRRSDFEKIVSVDKAPAQYRCEDCGAMLHPQMAEKPPLQE